MSAPQEMRVEYLAVGSVHPAPWNPKCPTQLRLEPLVASLRKNGNLSPFITATVDGREIVLDGNQRLEASKQCGFETVPARRLGVMTEAKARAVSSWLVVHLDSDRNMLAELAESVRDDPDANEHLIAALMAAEEKIEPSGNAAPDGSTDLLVITLPADKIEPVRARLRAAGGGDEGAGLLRLVFAGDDPLPQRPEFPRAD